MQIARFNGTCHDRCGLRIHAGHDLIEPGHFGWHHVNCEQANLNAQIRRHVAEGWTANRVMDWLNNSPSLTTEQRIDAIFYATRSLDAEVERAA